MRAQSQIATLMPLVRFTRSAASVWVVPARPGSRLHTAPFANFASVWRAMNTRLAFASWGHWLRILGRQRASKRPGYSRSYMDRLSVGFSALSRLRSLRGHPLIPVKHFTSTRSTALPSGFSPLRPSRDSASSYTETPFVSTNSTPNPVYGLLPRGKGLIGSSEPAGIGCRRISGLWSGNRVPGPSWVSARCVPIVLKGLDGPAGLSACRCVGPTVVAMRAISLSATEGRSSVHEAARLSGSRR